MRRLSAEVEAAHKRWTGPGSFYDLNGGRFKGQRAMTRDEELEYVASALPPHAPD